MSPPYNHETKISPSLDQMSEDLSSFVIRSSQEAIDKHGMFTIAISGGSLPKILGKNISTSTKAEFSKWHIFLADERCVPHDHEDSNFLLIKNHILDKINVPDQQVYKINPDLISDPSAAAEEYQTQLRKLFTRSMDVKYPVFDLILLGIGPDGHTCSLFPNHDLLKIDAAYWVASITDSPKPPPNRITLTLNVLNHARCCAFVVSDREKQNVVSKIFNEKEANLPAQMVNPGVKGKLIWFLIEGSQP